MNPIIKTPLLQRNWGGYFRIQGTVRRNNNLGSYWVGLYSHITGKLLSSTRSLPDGTYVFDAISYVPNGYFVVAVDNADTQNPLNADILDFITPEPMA